jgi:hypothetical protein
MVAAELVLVEAGKNANDADLFAFEDEVEVDENEPWLLSFADMFTLLVSFFCVLLSMATFDMHKYEKAADALAAEFSKKEPEPVKPATIEVAPRVHATARRYGALRAHKGANAEARALRQPRQKDEGKGRPAEASASVNGVQERFPSALGPQTGEAGARSLVDSTATLASSISTCSSSATPPVSPARGGRMKVTGLVWLRECRTWRVRAPHPAAPPPPAPAAAAAAGAGPTSAEKTASSRWSHVTAQRFAESLGLPHRSRCVERRMRRLPSATRAEERRRAPERARWTLASVEARRSWRRRASSSS